MSLVEKLIWRTAGCPCLCYVLNRKQNEDEEYWWNPSGEDGAGVTHAACRLRGLLFPLSSSPCLKLEKHVTSGCRHFPVGSFLLALAALARLTCLMFTIWDQGGSDSKVIVLTPRTWEAFGQIIVCDQLTNQATPPIVTGGKVGPESGLRSWCYNKTKAKREPLNQLHYYKVICWQ